MQSAIRASKSPRTVSLKQVLHPLRDENLLRIPVQLSVTAHHRQHVSPSVEEINSTRSKHDSRSGFSTNSSPVDVPAHFRRQKGPRGKQRIKKFEYSRYNVSTGNIVFICIWLT